jgi:hypothetical protein
MAAVAQVAMKKESSPFLIELPEELKCQLREEKPKNLSLRRYIVVLLTNRPLAQLYKNNRR